ncbi:MAG: efflux RND transporter periplasmic adaptor subunit [Parvularculaceae bacterium]|nr:efflux RND transporter periplasmic adaptor subunit [Parvularculaceae bacterium]
MDMRAESGMADLSGRKSAGSLARRAVVFAAPVLILAGAVGGFMFLQATAVKPEKNDEPPLPIAVEIATARAEDTTLRVTTQGQVKAKNEAEIAAQVQGQLLEISPQLEPGAYFKKGDVLARIDPAQYALAVDRSRSQVARAREALARARSEADLAERDWRDLGLSGDPSDLTLQKPQVNAAIADMRTAEAAVRESELNLERTIIRAPFDGRVKARTANVGDFISPGAPLASIFAIDVAQVRAPLTDADLGVLGLAPGFIAGADAPPPAAHLSAVVAGERREWTGKLVLVEAAIDPQTRLVYGLVEVENPFADANAAPLAPGLFVDVRIDSGETQRLVSLPRSALKKNQYVYAVDKDFAIKAREVTPAMADASRIYFVAGVEPGEKFVASFLPSPRDGMKVRDIDAPPAKPVDAAGEKDKVAAAAKKKK